MEELQKQMDEQGYVILREFLEPAVQSGLRGELETLVDEHARHLIAVGSISNPLKNEPFDNRLFRLYENDVTAAPRRFREELHRNEFFNLFFHHRLLDVVEKLLGEEIRLYPNYTVRPKFPNWEGHRVNWHQDGGYTGKEQEAGDLRMVNVWTPLVPAKVENGCMQFIPGTHKLGVVPHDEKEHYLEIAPEHLNPRLAEAVDIEMQPGDVVLFHNLLFHQGLPNRTQTIRWSVDWRYQDATQPTMRRAQGHIARSRSQPSRAVGSASEWAQLSFE